MAARSKSPSRWTIPTPLMSLGQRSGVTEVPGSRCTLSQKKFVPRITNICSTITSRLQTRGTSERNYCGLLPKWTNKTGVPCSGLAAIRTKFCRADRRTPPSNFQLAMPLPKISSKEWKTSHFLAAQVCRKRAAARRLQGKARSRRLFRAALSRLIASRATSSSTNPVESTEKTGGEDRAVIPLAAEELIENAATVGPEHQYHTRQRASGHHTRRHRQGELFGELRFPFLK